MRRCKYSAYWYYPIVVMLDNYKKLDQDENATLAIEFKKAIDDTIEEFEKTEEGREAIKAIQMIHFNKTHTMEGVRRELNLSISTAKRRRKAFIYAVGEKMHFR